MRITRSSSLLPALERGRPVQILVDGTPLAAFEGETIAAALLAQDIVTFRHTAKRSQPRGLYCGMGICYDCLVTVNGVHNVRACMTPVEDGMNVETQAEWKP